MRLQLLQLMLQFGKLGIGLLDDHVDVGNALFVGGHTAQIFRPLHNLELLLDLLTQIVAKLFQFLRQRRVRQMRLDSIFDTQLV